MWILFPDHDTWKLALSLSAVTREGPKRGYELVQKALVELRPEVHGISLSVAVLGDLASLECLEIGTHCHPWNTPPLCGEGAHRSMMCTLSHHENGEKLREMGRCLRNELGVVPKVFKAGRWGFGPSVAGPLAEEGYEIDCSVTPFIDWSPEAGPDYSDAPYRPYRFDPADPLQPTPAGGLLELPATVGFLSGDHRSRAKARRWLENSPLRHVKFVGIMDVTGVLARRWLSPETSSGNTMIKLSQAWVSSGQSFLQMTFHSCALLPAATPFVRNKHDRTRFLRSIDEFLSYCSQSGFVFRTLSEAGRHLEPLRE